MKFVNLPVILTYLFTALLPVHVGAMHMQGNSEYGHDHTMHSHTDAEHSSCECDDTHQREHDHGDMELCLNQSVGTLTGSYTVDHSVITQWYQYYAFKFWDDLTLFSDAILDQYLFINDPWRDEPGAFAQFIKHHYWETVLHC